MVWEKASGGYCALRKTSVIDCIPQRSIVVYSKTLQSRKTLEIDCSIQETSDIYCIIHDGHRVRFNIQEGPTHRLIFRDMSKVAQYAGRYLWLISILEEFWGLWLHWKILQRDNEHEDVHGVLECKNGSESSLHHDICVDYKKGVFISQIVSR